MSAQDISNQAKREALFDFIENTPLSVVLADGRKTQPLEEPLPIQHGVHIVPGRVYLPDGQKPFAVIELDAQTGAVVSVFLREGDGWQDYSHRSPWALPTFNIKSKNKRKKNGVAQVLPFWLQIAYFGHHISERMVWIVLGGAVLFFGGLTGAGIVATLTAEASGLHWTNQIIIPIFFGAALLLTFYLIVANREIYRRMREYPEAYIGSAPESTAQHHAFNFSASDLITLRQGFMGRNQRRSLFNFLLNSAIISVLISLVLFAVAVLVGIGFVRQIVFLIVPSDVDFELWQLLIFGFATSLTTPAFLAIAFSIRKQIDNGRQDLREGRVAVVTGTAQKEVVTSSEHSSFYVTVGDKRFYQKSVMQYKAFVEGRVYTVYYAPRCNLILAIE